MTLSDYWDIEILASRKGILPSQELARREKDKERQKRFHEQNKGYRAEQQKRWEEEHPNYRTEQSKRFREKHPGYYTNARKDRSEYYRRYYQSRKENIRQAMQDV